MYWTYREHGRLPREILGGVFKDKVISSWEIILIMIFHDMIEEDNKEHQKKMDKIMKDKK